MSPRKVYRAKGDVSAVISEFKERIHKPMLSDVYFAGRPEIRRQADGP